MREESSLRCLVPMPLSCEKDSAGSVVCFVVSLDGVITFAYRRGPAAPASPRGV